jgi:hypothetical protein
MKPEECTGELLTAYHEAAHAVSRLALGLRFQRATIEPSEFYSGCVERDPSEIEPMGKAVVTGLAGSIATDILLGSRWIPRGNLDMGDWSSARWKIYTKHNPVPPPKTPEEEAELEAIADRLSKNGADGRPGQLMVEFILLDHPAISAVVEVELHKLARAAERLIHRRWAAVETVAAALLDKKTLSYPEVIALLRISPREAV